MAASWLHLSFINLGPWLALHLENANQAPLHARKGMIHQDVVPGHIQLEIHDGCAARRDGDGLHTPSGRALHVAQSVNTIEDFSDDVKRRGKVWTADTKENADRFAHLRLHRVEFRERAHGAVENEILGTFVQ